jgi:hypothetical protein
MIEEAKAAGLLVDPDKRAEVMGLTGSGKYVPAKPDAPSHESLKGAWNIAEFTPKRHWNWKTSAWEHRMNLYRRRTIPPGSLIHDAAYLRGPDYQKFIPADSVRVSTRSA